MTNNFNKIYEKILKKNLSGINESPYYTGKVENKDIFAWLGSCNNACKGMWTRVEPVSKEWLKKLFNDAPDHIDKGDQTDLLYSVIHYIYDDESNATDEIHRHFPLKCYFPHNYAEFEKILDSDNLVRFWDPESEQFHVISKDKEKASVEIDNALNAIDEWRPGGCGGY